MPLMGRDIEIVATCCRNSNFNPTRPTGDATIDPPDTPGTTLISTPARFDLCPGQAYDCREPISTHTLCKGAAW